MKNKHLGFKGLLFIAAISLVLTNCRKKDPNLDNDTAGSLDNSLAEHTFNDMQQISDEGSKGEKAYKLDGGSSDGLLSTCATVDTNGMAANNTFTIDFGTSNCLCSDGRYRRGKIFVSYTPGVHGFGYWDSLCNITITTLDPNTGAYTYFVNDHQVKGTRSVTNNGRNSLGHFNWTVTENGQIVKPSGGTITWNANRNREWTAGYTTLLWIDDVYAITGSANGTFASGATFNQTITSPIIVKIGCPYRFVSGTYDYTPGSKPTRHVDFSPPNNGGCDNKATVTINSNVYTISF